MKKRVILFLVMVLTITAIFSTACINEEDSNSQSQTVKLTLNNYKKYLNIHYSYTINKTYNRYIFDIDYLITFESYSDRYTFDDACVCFNYKENLYFISENGNNTVNFIQSTVDYNDSPSIPPVNITKIFGNVIISK